jgi:hypothetical protein
MRAARMAWAVAGICRVWDALASWWAPRSPAMTFVSTSVRTLSSRKKGLPSVRSISSRLSG